jgi:hypothetical protein
VLDQQPQDARLFGRVELVSVGEHETPVVESRADVIRYLGWHGITATARYVKPLSRSIGDTLLHEASEAEIGMLLMGAYSHSACASCSSAE